MVNIMEAHITMYKQLVIYLSYFDNCGPKKVIEDLAKYLNMDIVNIKKYITPTKIMINDTEFDDYYNVDNYDYNSINVIVNKKKSEKNGVLLVGGFLDPTKINFTINYHIHLSLNKQNIFDIYKNNKKFKDVITEDNQKLLVNKLIYPAYLKFLKDSNISVFTKIYDDTMLSNDQIEELVWNLIIAYIKKTVETKNQKRSQAL